MKNYLGHDDESEIFTVVKRMQEGKFKILTFDENVIKFKIILHFSSMVYSVILNSSAERTYVISKDNNYNFDFYQIDGKPIRRIDRENGYIIWALLEEKMYQY